MTPALRLLDEERGQYWQDKRKRHQATLEGFDFWIAPSSWGGSYGEEARDCMKARPLHLLKESARRRAKYTRLLEGNCIEGLALPLAVHVTLSIIRPIALLHHRAHATQFPVRDVAALAQHVRHDHPIFLPQTPPARCGMATGRATAQALCEDSIHGDCPIHQSPSATEAFPQTLAPCQRSAGYAPHLREAYAGKMRAIMRCV